MTKGHSRSPTLGEITGAALLATTAAGEVGTEVGVTGAGADARKERRQQAGGHLEPDPQKLGPPDP